MTLHFQKSGPELRTETSRCCASQKQRQILENGWTAPMRTSQQDTQDESCGPPNIRHRSWQPLAYLWSRTTWRGPLNSM